MGLFVTFITVLIVLAALSRIFSPQKERPRDRASLPETFARDSDGHVIDSSTDARMRQAFNGLNSNLSFLGGQTSWDLGPPPPAATLEEDNPNSQALTPEELAAMQP